MPAPVPDSSPPPSGTPSQHAFWARAAGAWLGALGVAGALWEQGAGAGGLALLAAQAVAWPLLARRLAARSASPHAAERHLLAADACLAGAWIVWIAGSLLPSALLAAVVTARAVTLGGTGLLRSCGLALAGVAAAGLALHPGPLSPHTGWLGLLACLPGLIGVPLMGASSAHALARRLGRERAGLERSNRLVRETLDAMQAGIVLYDAEDRLVLCNADFRALYGPIASQLRPGRTFEQMLTHAVSAGMIPEARGHEQHWIAQRLRIHRQPGEPVLRELPSGRWRRIVEHRLSDGSLLAFSTDVTDLVQREQRLEKEIAAREAAQTQLRHANASLARLSGTDHLTGLANRREFERRLEQEWLRAARRGVPMSVLMIDVDHFKAYNDHHGHLQGDTCLREVGEALAACARRAGDVLARYGGEEFVLLLPDTGAQEAALVARQCLESLDARALPHGAAPGGAHLTLSIGHATGLPRRDGTPQALLQAADRALYRAKRAGRHTVAGAEGTPAPEPLLATPGLPAPGDA